MLIFQTLSSLALVFALHHYKPTPLYVMDEIDAALGMPLTFVLNCFPHYNFLFDFHPWMTCPATFTCVADFKNVSIVGHYVKDRTKDAQFIIIRLILSNHLSRDCLYVELARNIFNICVYATCSLRNNMFELADRLVGIYKTDNCTKSITINPGSFVVCEQIS